MGRIKDGLLVLKKELRVKAKILDLFGKLSDNAAEAFALTIYNSYPDTTGIEPDEDGGEESSEEEEEGVVEENLEEEDDDEGGVEEDEKESLEESEIEEPEEDEGVVEDTEINDNEEESIDIDDKTKITQLVFWEQACGKRSKGLINTTKLISKIINKIPLSVLEKMCALFKTYSPHLRQVSNPLLTMYILHSDKNALVIQKELDLNPNSVQQTREGSKRLKMFMNDSEIFLGKFTEKNSD